MARGFLTGLILGALVSVLLLATASLVAQPPVIGEAGEQQSAERAAKKTAETKPAPRPANVSVPPGSEFNRNRPDATPVIPGNEKAGGASETPEVTAASPETAPAPDTAPARVPAPAADVPAGLAAPHTGGSNPQVTAEAKPQTAPGKGANGLNFYLKPGLGQATPPNETVPQPPSPPAARQQGQQAEAPATAPVQPAPTTEAPLTPQVQLPADSAAAPAAAPATPDTAAGQAAAPADKAAAASAQPVPAPRAAAPANSAQASRTASEQAAPVTAGPAETAAAEPAQATPGSASAGKGPIVLRLGDLGKNAGAAPEPTDTGTAAPQAPAPVAAPVASAPKAPAPAQTTVQGTAPHEPLGPNESAATSSTPAPAATAEAPKPATQAPSTPSVIILNTEQGTTQQAAPGAGKTVTAGKSLTPPAVGETVTAPGAGATGKPGTPPVIRLPRIGDQTAGPSIAAAPEAGAAPSEAPAAGTEGDTIQLGALARNAQAFEAQPGLPLLSIVLIDAGAQGLSPEALQAFSFPITIAVNPDDPDAAKKAAAYRAAGAEVIVLEPPLRRGTSVQSLQDDVLGYMQKLPMAIGIVDAEKNGFQGNRRLVDGVIAALAEDGGGLLTYDRGFNSAQQLADKQGVPAALIYRSLDAQHEDATAISRTIDRAALKAGQEGAAVMIGHSYPETVKALYTWVQGQLVPTVQLAPLSAVLRRP